MELLVNAYPDLDSRTIICENQYKKHGIYKKNALFSVGHTFIFIVMSDIKYRGSAICIATPFLVNSH